jgi:hypothetical protein
VATFPWQCPYCGHHATIGSDNHSTDSHCFDKEAVDGPLAITTIVTVCPNIKCRRFSLDAHLRKAGRSSGYLVPTGVPLESWQLRPASRAKPQPDYVPLPVRQDYEEACAIQHLSPKASATLSRRCLQGMIRDFFGFAKSRLIDEIEALRDKVDPSSWESIDAVRAIGNIGAHMEKDINVIVDVEPEEARLLIELLESLIEDWYVARHQRQTRAAQIKAIAAEKLAARAAGAGSE